MALACPVHANLPRRRTTPDGPCAKVVNRSAVMRLTHQAEAAVPGMAERFKAILDKHLRFFAANVKQGKTPQQIILAHQAEWLADYERMKHPWAVALAMDGYRMASAFLKPGKSYRAKDQRDLDFTARQVQHNLLFGHDALIANHLAPDVAKWITQTSNIETATSSKKLAELYKRAQGTSAEAEDSWTPSELADAIVQEGLALDESRAEMLARTMNNWAYNEGAMKSYKDAGVAAKEWLATDDDRVRPEHWALNGVIVDIDADFLSEGDSYTVNDQEYQVDLDVGHPPLAPNCRCCLKPVILMSDEALSDDNSDADPEG